MQGAGMARALQLFLVAARMVTAAGSPHVYSGVDLSQIGTEDGNGKDSPFRAVVGGPTIDPLLLLKKSGVNTFRMRMWNDPCADGRCDPEQWSYAGLQGVLLMARRCQAANLTFVLDFHYSDWWADPGKQRKPTAWLHLPYKELGLAIFNFTRATLAALVRQGTPPYSVQIGNEITHGFVWNNATDGQSCADGGKLYCTEPDGVASAKWGAAADRTGGSAGWPRFAGLVAQGIKAAREACPSTKIAIHTDLGNHICSSGPCEIGSANVRHWYGNLSAALAASPVGAQTFDLIGLSMCALQNSIVHTHCMETPETICLLAYTSHIEPCGVCVYHVRRYPKWSNGSVFPSIAELPKLASDFPASRVYIAETSYPACCASTPPPVVGYPATEAGQLSYISDVSLLRV